MPKPEYNRIAARPVIHVLERAGFEITGTHEFKRWILGYGRHAKILKPTAFAEELRDEVRTMLDR